MDAFQSVLRFVMNQKSTIGYSFMAILTIGGERIFSMVSFQCPCNRSQNFFYGLTFLLSPAFVLLVLGYFFSTRMWRLFTGCCLNPLKLCPRGNCLGCVKVFIRISVGACVAPVMWLSVALLNGTFYECAVSGLESNEVVNLFCKNKTYKCKMELPRVPCGKSNLPKEDNQELLLMLRAQSQGSCTRGQGGAGAYAASNGCMAGYTLDRPQVHHRAHKQTRNTQRTHKLHTESAPSSELKELNPGPLQQNGQC
ncbi:calcium homeostasis modulator protein 5-like isoform X2 [Lepisosteus oculatus]|uniref:calcium homeostasis modulator protein 5-like isoform X2 n=1 Tax=Lepisosteus oculatus TaxID=7918 RepID=UPI0007403575|nr:PREDICTED: protein FAM26E-like isoform X2 [Lepisosteus oculatus]